MAKKLYRSRNDRMIAGVCAGLGNYFGIESTLVRIGWILIAFIESTGIIAYIICAVVFPEGPKSNKRIESDEYTAGDKDYDEKDHVDNSENEKDNRSKILTGSILIILGALFIIRRYVYWFDFSNLWPIILIIAGGYVIYKGKEGK